MLNNRIIPCLQLIGDSLVKKVKFDKHGYIGDPINTVRIFNELEVDELCFLDISATTEKRKPNLKVLKEIANECFMPLSYGGGIENIQTVHEILSIGFEKIILNTSAFENPKLITEIVDQFGSQSLIISIDVKKNLLGKYSFFTNCGKSKQKIDPIEWAKSVEKLGAGELLITSMEREGTWHGYDIAFLNKISNSVNIPIIANGGAGNVDHIIDVFENTEIAAVAVGSMLVYQAKGLGVLVNFPDKKKLERWNK